MQIFRFNYPILLISLFFLIHFVVTYQIHTSCSKWLKNTLLRFRSELFIKECPSVLLNNVCSAYMEKLNNHNCRALAKLQVLHLLCCLAKKIYYYHSDQITTFCNLQKLKNQTKSPFFLPVVGYFV